MPIISGLFLPAFSAAFGGVSVGAMFAIPLLFKTSSHEIVDFPFTQDDLVIYQYSFAASAAIGALLAGRLMTMISYRHIVFIYQGCAIIINLFFDGYSSNANLIMIRILQGIICGILSTIIPIYIGEISTPTRRSRLLTMFPMAIYFGIQAAIFKTMESVPLILDVSWCFNLIHLLLTIFIPESPYFLLSKNKKDEANKSLFYLRHATDISECALELSVIKNEVERQNTTGLFSDGANRKSLLVGVGIMFFYQITGIHIYYNYFSYIEPKLSEEDYSYHLLFILWSQIFLLLLVLYWTRKFNRRTFLLISMISMCLCYFATTISCFTIDKTEYNDNDMILFMVILIFICFHIGLAFIPWIIVGEIFSFKTKSYGPSLSVAVNWFTLAILMYSQESIYSNPKVFLLISTLFGVLGIIFVKYNVPETKDYNLAEIQTLLAGNPQTEDAQNV